LNTLLLYTDNLLRGIDKKNRNNYTTAQLLNNKVQARRYSTVIQINSKATLDKLNRFYYTNK
jgi:hypothetical protein